MYQIHRELFQPSNIFDRLSFFQSLLDSRDLTADQAFALLNTIRLELETPQSHKSIAYTRYGQVMESLHREMPEVYEQIVNAWKAKRGIVEVEEAPHATLVRERIRREPTPAEETDDHFWDEDHHVADKPVTAIHEVTNASESKMEPDIEIGEGAEETEAHGEPEEAEEEQEEAEPEKETEDEREEEGADKEESEEKEESKDENEEAENEEDEEEPEEKEVEESEDEEQEEKEVEESEEAQEETQKEESEAAEPEDASEEHGSAVEGEAEKDSESSESEAEAQEKSDHMISEAAEAAAESEHVSMEIGPEEAESPGEQEPPMEAEE